MKAKPFDLTRDSVESLIKQKVREVANKPEYMWADSRRNYMCEKADGGDRDRSDRDGSEPVVRVGMANCRLDHDLWDGLRNPASVGLHPAGLREIWEFFATKNIRRVRPDGSVNHLAAPEPFESAKERFKRVTIISALLPFSREMLEGYRQIIISKSEAPYDGFCKAYGEVNTLFDESLSRAALELFSDGRAVIPMTNRTVKELSETAIPKIHQGVYHGPCKGGHFPQKSVGVLTGLVQLGVSRIAFRDELMADEVVRLVGPLRSVIVFDSEDPVTDGSGGIINLDQQWSRWVFSLSDFTNTDREIARRRFCRHTNDSGSEEKSCSLCIELCPSGAQAESSPKPDGTYAPQIQAQKSRWYKSDLQFAFSECVEERTQKSDLFPQFMCGRCMVICALAGKRSADAARAAAV